MHLRPHSRRHLLKTTVAALLSSTLMISACSRAEDTENTTATSEPDTRIASVGLGDADTLLALGITPVLVAPWGAEGDTDSSGVGPWSKELLGDAQPALVYGTGLGFTAEILEKISAADPDQIIAVNNAVDEQAKEDLEKIAPTTVKPEGTTDWQIPWQDQVTQIAGAVDKQKEGKELIDTTEKAFEDFKAAHPELKGKSAAIVMPYEGKIGFYTSGDGRGQFIENLGFEIPEELEGDGSTFYRDIAPENYRELENLDYLFVLDYQGAAEALKNDSVFNNLKVVRENKVRWLSEDVGVAMSMPNPVTIPWAIEELTQAL